ncbi:type II toxin-antitoxin system HicB family antitoxin [Candidatus Acetothermia bacterium]|nr:type II toxin-antitoxin system HicB family antitoxin [Candidatus Acetothermia bacterium]MBI3459983.1 type II toxin-antitoxin system HicB family antitoxin [Candidatus Acetothermia bacterium]MBI3659972.1 type II toxin-antitoxin system HicB family antitoxin [Candidatus Acetothermia bacterium]
MTYTYTVIFERAEEGGYLARVPTLGATTQGETLAEAREMARDLIQGHLEALLKMGRSIPPGSPPTQRRRARHRHSHRCCCMSLELPALTPKQVLRTLMSKRAGFYICHTSSSGGHIHLCHPDDPSILVISLCTPTTSSGALCIASYAKPNFQEKNS